MPAQIDFTKIDTLPQNLSKDEVKRLQKFLNEQGYSVKSPTSKGTGVDGVMGPYTQNAWDSYVQSRNAQSQAQAEQERLAREAEQKKVAEQKAQENVAQVVAFTDPAKQVTTPVQTSTPTTAVPAPKSTVVLPSSIDTKKVVEDLYPKKDKATAPAEKPVYDVTGPEIEAAGVTATQNKTLKPIDMLNLGQMEMHKDRVNAIKGIGKTGEEDTTETTTTTENPTATQTFDQAMADRSYLQELFDERRKLAEKERTNQLSLASYNSLGNALRSLAQPIGWAAGQATAGVQPYDKRAYLDAFNRAVAASNDLRNINDQEAEYYLNREEWDRRQAVEQANFEQRRQIELNYRQKAKEIAEAATSGEGKTPDYDRRKTTVVSEWLGGKQKHGKNDSLSDLINAIETAFPGFFGDKKPTAEEIAQIEQSAGTAKANTNTQSTIDKPAGGVITDSKVGTPMAIEEIVALPSLPSNMSKQNVKTIQSFLKSKGYNLGSSGPQQDGVDGDLGNKTRTAFDYYKRGITAKDLSILEKWQSVDPTPDTPFTKADLDALKARKKKRPKNAERKAYEEAWVKMNPDKVEKKGQGHKAFGA